MASRAQTGNEWKSDLIFAEESGKIASGGLKTSIEREARCRERGREREIGRERGGFDGELGWSD